MTGTMSQADLVADLKSSLQDVADVFTASNDADFVRHIERAAHDLIRVHPHVLAGTLTLTADLGTYPAPPDLVRVHRTRWADSYRGQQWDRDWPGPFPRVSVVRNGANKLLFLTPAPNARQIAVLGQTFPYDYCAHHLIGENAVDTTVDTADRSLLLLRAQAEAMKELALRNLAKPVSLGPPGASVGSMPKNGSPAGLYELLMSEFQAA
jgi:hypothetical protein